MTPSVSGEVTTWGVTPALPAGLTLDAGSGVISGTPTAASTSTSYKITATNAGGSSSTTIALAVSATSVGYQYGSYVFTPGLIAQTLLPMNVSAPAITGWSVKPALPAGLTLDPASGTISGLPTTATAAASYTVTASNSQGGVSTVLTLTVAGTTLVDLGLGSYVQRIRYVNASVLSQDSDGAWVLQDYASGTTLARGAGFSFVFPAQSLVTTAADLENNVMIDETPGAIEVRSATSGQILTTIPVPAQPSCNLLSGSCPYNWYRLATDGSYVVSGTASALTVWSIAGQMLFSVAGDYSQALQESGDVAGVQPFAAPGQVQIATGPAGANVIQTFTVPGGAVTQSPAFQGTFSSWFTDGASFLSTQSNTVWIYTAAGVQRGIAAPTTTFGLAGSGNWFWTLVNLTLNVYQVGSNTPALTLADCCVGGAVASGSTLGLLGSGANSQGVTILDLSGATLASTTYPNVPLVSLTGYGAQSATQWLTGNSYGVVLDGASLSGTPRTLTLGAALSVAAGTGYISVATAAGKILFFDASTDALAGTINFPAAQVAASSDGTVLAAYADWSQTQSTDSTLNIYSLPGGAVLDTFPYTVPTMALTGIGLSGSGTVAAETFESPSSECLTQVIPVTGGAPIVCDNATGDANVQLSPDGTLAAISPAPGPLTVTHIYQNGILMAAVPGYALGWLDNSRVLLNNYTEPMCCIEATGLTIYDASGTNVGASPITTTDALQIAPGASSVYDLNANAILSLTGTASWASGSTSRRTLGGTNVATLTPSQVVFAADNTVVAVPH